MSQIPTAPDVPRDARGPDPNATPTPPSTRYPHPPAAATPRPPPLTTTPTATNLAGNQVSLQTALASVQGDPLVALETVLGERNTLSSQNSQLWKIIEKQRGMYNSLHKELDRVKADRDRLQSKSSTDLSSKRAAAGDSTSRKQITRSQSEDRPLRAVAPSTRSQEPANSIDHPASMHPQTLSRTDAQTSNPTRHGSLPTASPPTPRQSSVPVPSVTATTGDSEAKFKAPNTPPTQPFSVQPQSPPQLNYAPLPPVSVPSIQSLLSVVDPEKSRRSARESRIMVPDEVARYIQAQQDSPMPSPRPRAAELPPSQESPDPIGGSPKPAPAVQQESTRSTPSHTPTDDDVPPEDRSSYYNPPFQALSPPPSHRKPPPSRDLGEYPTVTAAGAADGPSTDSQRNTRSTTSSEEMDSDSVTTGRIPSRPSPVTSSSGSTTDGGSTAPRSNFQSYNDESTQSLFSPYQSTNAYGNYQQQQQYNQTPTMNQALQSFQTNGYPPSAEILAATATANGNMFQTSSYPSQGNISRSNPPLLVPMELPITRIRVVSSHIRSNERGKDVLAFCIQVQPSQREPWVIEKMYSDVLALDSRVRALLSKNTLKKLAPLPDSKLFKDNAPAKVDQRKMLLEQYLQSVVTAPLKDVGDLCAFLVTDLSKGDRAPVSNQGYKEGYLTKRGKNFGGWKTRYFILQNGVLEYYENRGGTHLGSINIAGAQIGRQQKQASVDDENAYRHAFLIIEAKRGPSGANIRHVLCASSDTDRDAWVDVLVRYVAGSFDDSYASGSSTGPSIEGHSRQSVGSMESQRPTARPRTMSNNDMVRGGGAILGSPLQQHDPNSAKLFHGSASQPEAISPTERPIGLSDAQLALRMIERGNSGGSISGFAMSTSLPSSLEPSIAQGSSASASYQAASQPSSQTSLSRRPSSEQGFYPESRGTIIDQRIAAPKSRLEKPSHRASTHPSLPTVDSSSSRQQLIDAGQGPDIDAGPGGKKISGPSNATPIPPGQGWGNKQPLLTTGDTPPSDRERKVKSKFWSSFNRVPGVSGMVSSGSGSGSDRERSNAGVPPPMHNSARLGDPALGGRAVFAVPLEQALSIAQIANLPAIVFRCIEYLEAKNSDQEEGIYRLSGSNAVIKSLKDRFNAEGDINLLKNDEYWDPHAIAGLLKLYLRELPTSLLTRELQQRFLGVVDLLDPKDRVTELSQLVASLPISNYSLLRALNAHLINIVQNNAVNKMNIRNMGIVFSPTLQIPAGIFSLMLSDFKLVFNVDAAESESDTTSTTDAESTVAEMSPSESKSGNRQQQQDRVNKRNSMLYAHASADQMLGLGGRQLETAEESDEDDVKVQDDDSDSDISYEDIRALPSDRPPRQSNGKQYQGQPTTPPVRIEAPEEDQQLVRGDSAKAVASNKGLQINVAVTPGVRPNRMSGLPHSPRPVGKTYHPPASPAMSNDSGSR